MGSSTSWWNTPLRPCENILFFVDLPEDLSHMITYDNNRNLHDFREAVNISLVDNKLEWYEVICVYVLCLVKVIL